MFKGDRKMGMESETLGEPGELGRPYVLKVGKEKI